MPNAHPARKLALPFLILILALFLAWFIPSRVIPVSWDFRNNLWGPAYLLTQHQSPYNIQAIFDLSNAIWMPVTIGFFFPIGYLPLQWASNTWFFLNLVSLFIIVLSFKNPEKSIFWLPINTILLVIFPSTMSHFLLGQISLIICLSLILLARSYKRLNPVLIGLILAFSSSKPQLDLVFIPVFLLNYYRERGAQSVLKVILFTISWLLILCLPLFGLFPNWIPDFLHNLKINHTWFYPSLFTLVLAKSFSLTTAYLTASIYLLAGIGIAIFLSKKMYAFETLLWSLAITPIFSPIIWSWDFVLIYPLFIYIASKKGTTISTVMLYSGFIICTVIFIAMKLNGFVDDQLSFWVPPTLLLFLIPSRLIMK